MARAIRPLRRSFSISAGDLQMIMVLQEAGKLLRNGFGLHVAVDLMEIGPLSVIVDQRPRLILVGYLALSNRLFRIVRPVDQRAAIQVADPFLLRALEANVIDLAADRARPPPGRPLDEQFAVDADVQSQRLPATARREQAIEKASLIERARKAVQDEAPGAVRVTEPVFYNTTNDFVRNQLPGIDHGLGHQ